MRKIFLSNLIFCFIASVVLAQNRPIMIDNTTKENITAVSNFVVGSKLEVSGITFFDTASPPAGQYLKISADGKQISTEAITSAVTGSGGVNSGNYKAIPYYVTAPSGATVGPLANQANSVLVTSGASLPSLSQTLPTAVQQNITILGSLSQGVSGTTGTFSGTVTANTFSGDGSLLTGVSGIVSSSTTGYVAVYTSAGQIQGTATISGSSVYGGMGNFGILTTSVITARSQHINLTSGTLQTLAISGISGVWVSAVSSAARSPTAGVSLQLGSPDAAGYDIVFILENSTYEQGTTTYVLFTAGDVLASADTITAGTSKYIMSGTTDAQLIVCHSTGVSKWFVRTVGSPTVAWD